MRFASVANISFFFDDDDSTEMKYLRAITGKTIRHRIRNTIVGAAPKVERVDEKNYWSTTDAVRSCAKT